MVAVISGRPVEFLAHELGVGPGQSRPRLFGLYGAEIFGEESSATARDPDRAALADIARRASSTVPGALIEDKGVSVTFHWRTRPDLEQTLIDLAHELAQRSNLRTARGRMSIEIFGSSVHDKASALLKAVGAHHTACFIGDDLGDLAAFDALDELGSNGVTVLRIAVASEESVEELLARADAVLDGPKQVVAFLDALATRVEA
jgi:trehalose 6-phosphate phosphatase